MQLSELWVGIRPIMAFRLVVVCAVAGFSFGAIVHRVLFNYSEAVIVVEIGRVTAGDSTNGLTKTPLEDIDDLSERVRGRTFTAEVGKRSGISNAEQVLSGFRYGGDAGLSTRTIWSNNQLELRIRAKDDTAAISLASAVGDTIIAQHQVIFNKLQDLNLSRLRELKSWIDLTFINRKVLDQKIVQSPGADANLAVLLVHGQQVDMARETSIFADLSANSLPPNTRMSEIISNPDIQPRILGSALSMGAAGMIAGLCLAVVILLLTPRNRAA